MDELPALPPLLQLVELRKSFGAIQALRGVSLELFAGEVHALLGENGAGKSTLIKIVTGAHRPDGGSVRIAGQAVEHWDPASAHAQGIACIYQQPALFAELSVAENLALRLDPVRAFGWVNWAGRTARARELLQRVGAGIDPRTEVRGLSMPDQQLVEIAAAVGAGARIVIMDEPTAALSRREQERLFGVVRELRGSGVGILYISHRLEEIFALADRVTVLRDGVSVGTRRLRVARAISPSRSPSPAEPPLTESDLIHLMVGRSVASTVRKGGGRVGEVVLEVRDLGCAVGGVQGVRFTARRGEIVGIAGLVGSGRTELARVLFGVTPADAGEIWLDGRVVRVSSPAVAVALGLAYVPEDRRRHGVISELPVSANISLAAHARLFPGGWIRRGAERDLAIEKIQGLGIKVEGPDALVGALSGGNQQKVALARWLATQPKVLILDEPTQGVDVGAKGEIHRLIGELAESGLAVLLISSDLPEVLALSDRLLVMREGTVVAELPGGSDGPAVMAAALGQPTSVREALA